MSDSEHLFKRGRIWYGWVYDSTGEKVDRSTGCTSKKAARAVLESWELATSGQTNEAGSVTINDVISIFLEEAQRTTSKETHEFYETKLGHVARILGPETPVRKIKDAADGHRYIDSRRSEKTADITIAKELKAFVSVLDLAKSRKQWSGDPRDIIPARFRPEAKARKRSPTRAEIVKLIPELPADTAAAVCFVLATGAEDAALGRAQRSDITDDAVHVHGSKNEARDRNVPIISPEQALLMRFVQEHARGEGDDLFLSIHNLRRDVAAACIEAEIPHCSTGDFRKAGGQWLLDQGIGIELVSLFLGHSGTAVTERHYARNKSEHLGERMQTALDVQLGRVAVVKRKPFPILKKLPEPKPPAPVFEYEAGGKARTLAEWAKWAGIPKVTLWGRVNQQGMSLAEALKKPGKTRKSPSSCHEFGKCSKRAANTTHKADTADGLKRSASPEKPPLPPKKPVSRDGIEPPTRGFSNPAAGPRRRKIGPWYGKSAASVQHRPPVKLTKPGKLRPSRTRWDAIREEAES